MDFGSLDLTTLKQTFESFGGLKAIQDTLTIAKQAKDLFGKSKDGKAADPAALQARELIAEMTDKMLTAKEETAALRATMLSVLEELGRLQTFERDREKYDLVETHAGSFAYEARGPVRGDHQAIRYCAHCFEQSQRVVTLQVAKLDFNRDTLKCSVCEGEIFQTNDNRPVVLVSSPRTNWNVFDV